ncbi:segregation/condensation protein A [Phormidium tenue]|uniref:Segregation and condensation protein A n=1 Tax=Phormidium tenue NIES-30 TaxID=549789 RepID=A0A1U7JB44_9CYAN|nr:segregation/condensation protein A [Phormidium tenue]MBD2230167.1 segregation/condensation protein A [Phormidium tenue FACHB-1052]OKH51004.1 segregation/condensation protein A [Phormidium tenue NIES-30]
MSSSLAQTAIAFLIDLADQGEIDPWDVKVIDVIDRFLSLLKSQAEALASQGRTPYEANLSESGQGFLYASMLVLLKADTMVRAEAEAEAEANPEEVWEEDIPDLVPLPRNLERHLHRRAVAPIPQRRQVTLHELIQQLETMATVMADHQPRIRARRARPQPQRQAVRAIAQLAHQENLSEIAAALEAFLDQYWDELGEDTLWIDFELLLEHWPQFKPADLEDAHDFETPHAAAIHEKVGVFWGLLFLSAQSKVELGQDQFYGDLRVRNLNRAPLTAAEAELPAFILPD